MSNKNLPSSLRRRPQASKTNLPTLLTEGSVDQYHAALQEMLLDRQGHELLSRMNALKEFVTFLNASIDENNVAYFLDLARRELPAMQDPASDPGRPSRWKGEDGFLLLKAVFELQLKDPAMSDRSAAQIACIGLQWTLKDEYDAYKQAKKHLAPLKQLFDSLTVELRKRGLTEL